MKQQVDRMVVQVVDRAVQVLGGYGYIREYPVELCCVMRAALPPLMGWRWVELS
ncbi:MAG: acyl-CoA dehydrogenase family protein [Chloroflexota bacterium]